MRAILILLASLSLAVHTGCPGSRTGAAGGPGGMPATVGTYEALRWVPADVSYAVTARTGADLSRLGRELVGLIGILEDQDVAAYGRLSTQLFGYDLFSVESLQGVGVDTARGVAIFSSGLSPTAVAALGDRARFDAFIEDTRALGVSIQSQIAGDLEVFSLAFPNREVVIHWTILDGWILSHVELVAEREPELAWLEQARAARGALGAHADLAAALEAGGGTPPVVAVVRPPQLVDALAAIVERDGGSIPPACAAPLREATRVLAAGGVDDAGARGTIVADLARPERYAVLAAPAGWYAARTGAPLQLDLGVDVQAWNASLGECGDAGFAELGVRTAHVAIHAFEDGLPSRGAAYADLSHDRVARQLLGQIPGLRMMSSKRRVGDVEVVDVDVPFMGTFTYQLTGERALAATGQGLVEAILAPGAAPAGEVFRLSLRPRDIPVEAWDLALEYGAGVSVAARRQRTIERLRRWSAGEIDARLDGSRLVINAAGTF